MQGKQQSANWRKQTLYIVSSEYIATVTGHRGINFLNDYAEADEEGRRWLDLYCNIQMNNKNPSAEKKQILYLILAVVSGITTTVASLTHCWHRRKKTNFLLHFWGFNSQKFLHESSYDRVLRKDYRIWWTEVKNWASVFHLWLLELFSWFQNGSILMTCKRRALIIEDEFKNTYFNLLIIPWTEWIIEWKEYDVNCLNCNNHCHDHVVINLQS